MAKHRIWLLLGLGLSALVCAAGPISRPRVRCDIPDRNYQFHKFSPQLRALSKTFVVLRPGTPASVGAPRRRTIKAFQFVDTPNLVIDHCAISNMTVLLDEDGNFTVTMRAVQNAEITERRITTSEPQQLVTANLLRNRFHVDVRCFGRHGPAGANPLMGKPIVVPIELQPFWVQRGQPDTQHQVGGDPRIKRYFDLIDRVEIEFKYEKS